ncbi:hypothetical protein O3M35_003393 [Rhynocoris fuscipes]|uniref:Uncharacterized protein n=1 Tax=Rhynocoris fuscipes TaxID=488301 RepID=A0AAW1CQN4_9HEMI
MLNARVDLLLPNSVNILHFAVEKFPCTQQIIHWICNDGFVSAYNLSVLINSFNDDGLTPFEMAASLGLLNCIKSMLGAYPRIVRNLRGTSACHLAARCGYADILEELIRYDPKCLEIKNRKDWTPLHVAARSGHGNCVIIMLRYGANISSCVVINDTSKSALDLIVDYVPMAKETFTNLFDTYITEINTDKTDAHSSIRIDYSLLVGTSYINNTKTSSKTSLNSSNESLKLMDYKKGRQMIFIKTLLNTTNDDLKETLLLHPLIETFLYFKWDSLKYFFIILLLLYLIYTTVLISFAFLNYVFAISTVNWILRPIILLILLPLGITEIIHASALPYVYFLDIESWLKIFMILTGTMVACISSELEASRYIVSLSVLNSWTVVLFLLARFPTWGLHVLMFQKVSYNVVEVLSRFIFLFVGFLLAFIIHFEGEPPFGNFWEATCKVMIMLFELDYSGIFEKGEKMTLHSLIGRFMFVAFGLLVAMVMVNLIVGLSVSDIAQLEKQGRSQRLAKQTSFLVSLELIVYNDWIVKCIPKCLQNSVQKYRKLERKKIVHPDDPNCPFSVQCKEALLRHGFCDEDEPSVEHCLQKINLLTDKVNELEVKMDKIITLITRKNFGLN